MHSDADRLAQWLGQVVLRDERTFAALFRATSSQLLDVAMLMMESHGLRLLNETLTTVGRGSKNMRLQPKSNLLPKKP